MNVDVVFLPAHLREGQLAGRTAVVFDVLRATTTMTAALKAGVAEIRVFGTLDDARAAALAFDGRRLLCGESKCLRPKGFDLGNSPGEFSSDHRGATAFMSTTNGTRAILAAQGAAVTFVAALVNASHAARAVAKEGRDVTLLCAGTQGTVAMDDVVGAGAVLSGLLAQGYQCATDTARMAMCLFEQARPDLLGLLRQTQAGRNVLNAGLTSDIDFSARLDVLESVGRVHGVSNTPCIRTFV